MSALEPGSMEISAPEALGEIGVEARPLFTMSELKAAVA
jgi:hypothetical protein